MTHLLAAWLSVLVVAAHVAAQPAAPREDEAIRRVLQAFYDGWNAHDPDRMIAVYADDIDHINVFGEWHKGKADIRADLAVLHAGPARNSEKQHTVEKIRFLGPEVAVAQVSSTSPNGMNLGTYVMQKQQGTWKVVSFTNVEPRKAPHKQTR